MTESSSTNNLGLLDYIRTLTLGGEEFRILGFHSTMWFNIEPSTRLSFWHIVAFDHANPAKPKRMRWIREGFWESERERNPRGDSHFLVKELDWAVTEALKARTPTMRV